MKEFQPDLNAKIIRLVDILGSSDGYLLANRSGMLTYASSSPFTIPEGLNLKQACLIISCLTDYCKNAGKVNSLGSTTPAVSYMLEDWGFKKVENADDYKFYCHANLKDHIPFKAKNLTTDYENYSNEGIVDLITCDCGNLILKRCSIKDYYFNWYTPNVSEEDIQAIYTLNDMSLPDK